MSHEEERKLLDEARQGEVLEMPNNESTDKKVKKVYLESYGCQMNFADSEIVASILAKDGYITTKNIDESDVVLEPSRDPKATF